MNYHVTLPNLKKCKKKQTIAGINSTYTLVGEFGASFAWHVEDYDLGSINYLYAGASKVWYTIRQKDAAQFYKLISTLYPKSDAQCPSFIRHKTTIVSPELLTKSHIPYTRTIQHAGQIVILFPHVFHSGFNTGFNACEVVSFGNQDWIKCLSATNIYQCSLLHNQFPIEGYLQKFMDKNTFTTWKNKTHTFKHPYNVLLTRKREEHTHPINAPSSSSSMGGGAVVTRINSKESEIDRTRMYYKKSHPEIRMSEILESPYIEDAVKELIRRDMPSIISDNTFSNQLTTTPHSQSIDHNQRDRHIPNGVRPYRYYRAICHLLIALDKQEQINAAAKEMERQTKKKAKHKQIHPYYIYVVPDEQIDGSNVVIHRGTTIECIDLNTFGRKNKPCTKKYTTFKQDRMLKHYEEAHTISNIKFEHLEHSSLTKLQNIRKQINQTIKRFCGECGERVTKSKESSQRDNSMQLHNAHCETSKETAKDLQFLYKQLRNQKKKIKAHVTSKAQKILKTWINDVYVI